MRRQVCAATGRRKICPASGRRSTQCLTCNEFHQSPSLVLALSGFNFCTGRLLSMRGCLNGVTPNPNGYADYWYLSEIQRFGGNVSRVPQINGVWTLPRVAFNPSGARWEAQGVLNDLYEVQYVGPPGGPVTSTQCGCWGPPAGFAPTISSVTGWRVDLSFAAGLCTIAVQILRTVVASGNLSAGGLTNVLAYRIVSPSAPLGSLLDLSNYWDGSGAENTGEIYGGPPQGIQRRRRCTPTCPGDNWFTWGWGPGYSMTLSRPA